eukprot:scaffold18920_cov64-Cyclotella_meneghiniana.AAC.3
MQHPTRKYLRVSKKRRVTMRVLLTSVTIELGVKATTFVTRRGEGFVGSEADHTDRLLINRLGD